MQSPNAVARMVAVVCLSSMVLATEARVGRGRSLLLGTSASASSGCTGGQSFVHTSVNGEGTASASSTGGDCGSIASISGSTGSTSVVSSTGTATSTGSGVAISSGSSISSTSETVTSTSGSGVTSATVVQSEDRVLEASGDDVEPCSGRVDMYCCKLGGDLDTCQCTLNSASTTSSSLFRTAGLGCDAKKTEEGYWHNLADETTCRCQ